jgi:hypothetical protein
VIEMTFIMLNVIVMSVALLTVIVMTVIILNVIGLCVALLIVIVMSVIIMNVVAPIFNTFTKLRLGARRGEPWEIT